MVQWYNVQCVYMYKSAQPLALKSIMHHARKVRQLNVAGRHMAALITAVRSSDPVTVSPSRPRRGDDWQCHPPALFRGGAHKPNNGRTRETAPTPGQPWAGGALGAPLVAPPCSAAGRGTLPAFCQRPRQCAAHSAASVSAGSVLPSPCPQGARSPQASRFLG